MQGPQPVKATFESWDASWGDFHYGTGIGSYVCHAGSGFHCGGKNAFSFFVLPAGSTVILASIPTVTKQKDCHFRASFFILHFLFFVGLCASKQSTDQQQLSSVQRQPSLPTPLPTCRASFPMHADKCALQIPTDRTAVNQRKRNQSRV